MELKFATALYICAGVAAVFVIAAFITFKMKKKYKGGKKAYLPDYLKKDPAFKSRLFWYNILKYVLIILIISSLLLSGFLMARPYKTESKQLANYNRDIILCMDISTTCDELNAVLIDKLEDVVKELNGERFGIVIFNTSPVLLCPLTSDYEYVIEVLEKVKEGDYICVLGTVGATVFKRKDGGDPGVNLTVLVQKWEFDPTVQMEQEATRALKNGDETMSEDYEEEVNEETLF